MQIVESPDEARQAINSNKMAIILSLEMDSLAPWQIQALVNAYGVRHVTPIHLANSPFGGSAVYLDLWNTNSWFLNNHQFMQVDFGPSITFRLGRPEALHSAMGALYPQPISDNEYNALGYDAQGGGHKNHLGISDPDAFLGLMQAGLLIDVAHMSEKSIDMALSQAETYGYPLMDSHTGIRDPQHPASENERNLLPSQATRIGNLGGVIGLGTAWDQNSTDPIADFSGAYQNALQFLGGRGVALGTDANGLQPLIAFTKNPLTDYQHNVAAKFAPPAGVATPDLGQFTLGARTYDIHQDGIANYGILPDFLEALAEYEQQSPPKAPSVSALYRSAEDVIEMWERAIATSANALPPPTVCQQPNYSQCVRTADSNFDTCKKDWDGPVTHVTVCAATLGNSLTACSNQFCQTPKRTQLSITERLFPAGDTGRFSLSINKTVELANVGDLADTGFMNAKIGVNTVSEAGANSTDPANYVVQFGGDCAQGDTSLGPLARPVSMSVGQQKTCSITNRGFPALNLQFKQVSCSPVPYKIEVDGVVEMSTQVPASQSLRLKGLTTTSHQVSVVRLSSGSGYSAQFDGDCSAAPGSQTSVLSLGPGDEKVCKITVQDNAGTACPAGQRSCGQVDCKPPLCVVQGATCDALCPPKQGKQGKFCDISTDGKPICVYPPAECQ